MSEEEEIYCICRSSDVSRFMIGCDHCEEWYHGDCIQVTARDSKYIKKFYCKECRDKNPHLKVVYKTKYADRFADNKDSAAKEDKKDEIKEKKVKEKKKSKDKDRDRSRSRDRHKHKDKKHKKDKDREKTKDKDKERKSDKEKQKERPSKADKKEPKSKPIISDSDDDDFVVIVEKSAEAKKKDREEEQQLQKKREQQQQLERQKTLEKERAKLREEKRKEKEREREAEIEAERKRNEERKKEKERSLSTENRTSRPGGESVDINPRKVLQAKNIENNSKYSSEDEWKPQNSLPAPAASNNASGKHKRKPFKDGAFNKRKRAWRPSYDSSDEEETHDLRPRQCYGMDCVNCARVGSKYCSDQCGLNVASRRIYETLPARIQEWNMTSCAAEQKNRKELDIIREDIQKTKQRLEELDKQTGSLEETIARGKMMTIIEHKSEDSSDEEDELKTSGAVNCISCGKDVPSRTAIRHMETCFNKFESQTSFGSMYKTKIEGYQMFCDYYNPQTETYCKRLRVICPEHTKDHKLSDTEVCGFPLTKDVFKETGEFCRLSRKECNDHYCWEKLKRAELDMDRVRQWLKLDELLEKERQEKEAMSRRAGVLNLLLHSTYNHELALLLQQKKNRAGQPLAKQAKRMC